jgi:deoxyribonuclease IV
MARKKAIVGAHVAPERPLAEAKAVGADCVQIFLSDPQGWRKPPPRKDAAELKRSKVPLYVHAPYLINVCSPRSNVRYGSRKILQQTCEAAADVGAAAVVVHPGHAEDGVAEGVARRFDNLARLWEAITKADSGIELGFCFDTCHAHAAGEDLSHAVERVLKIVGRIDLLHANDSRDPPGTGADRHTSLGKGTIGVEALRGMIRAAGPPVVVEDPGGDEAIRADLEFVRKALA